MKHPVAIQRNKAYCIYYLFTEMTCVFFLFIIFTGCENENYPYYIKSDDHGVLWVANAGDNTITCIDRIYDEEIGTFDVGSSPSRTAVDLEGNCWVGCREDNTVYFVTQEGLIRRFDGFSSARGVALDKYGNVWIANSGNNTIQKISIPDTIISEQIDLPDIGGMYYGGLVDGNGNFWILDRTSCTMIKYDTEQFPNPNACVIIQLPYEAYGFTIDTENTVWVSGFGSPYLYEINSLTAEIINIHQIPAELFGGSITGVTFDIYGEIWISTFTSHQVLRFNPESTLFESFPTNANTPHGLGSDDLGFIYTVNYGSNDITKINAETGQIVNSYKVGNGPYTYSDLTGFIYRHVTLNSK